MTDLLPALSDTDRDLHEAVVDAAQILETALDLREVEWAEDEDGYGREPS